MFCFALEGQNQITAQAKLSFLTWVRRLLIEMNVHIANFVFDKSHKYQHFVS